jgi:hypothetical protein
MKFLLEVAKDHEQSVKELMDYFGQPDFKGLVNISFTLIRAMMRAEREGFSVCVFINDTDKKVQQFSLDAPRIPAYADEWLLSLETDLEPE